MKAEIISIGTEILLGEITDTNAAYIASRLPFLGIDLYWISQVGDNKTRIIEILERAWSRSDIVFISGGLGPTADDVTRESIAEMLGEEMKIDAGLEKTLRDRFGRYVLCQWLLAVLSHQQCRGRPDLYSTLSITRGDRLLYQ